MTQMSWFSIVRELCAVRSAYTQCVGGVHHMAPRKRKDTFPPTPITQTVSDLNLQLFSRDYFNTQRQTVACLSRHEQHKHQ